MQTPHQILRQEIARCEAEAAAVLVRFKAAETFSPEWNQAADEYVCCVLSLTRKRRLLERNHQLQAA